MNGIIQFLLCTFLYFTSSSSLVASEINFQDEKPNFFEETVFQDETQMSQEREYTKVFLIFGGNRGWIGQQLVSLIQNQN